MRTLKDITAADLDSFMSVCFSPDGKSLVSGLRSRISGSVKIWFLSSGTCVCNLLGHKSGCVVNSVAFSPNGSSIASGSQDRTVRLWSSASGTCLNTLEGH